MACKTQKDAEELKYLQPYFISLPKMRVRHAGISPELVHVLFLECVANPNGVTDMQSDVAPECLSVLTDLLEVKWI